MFPTVLRREIIAALVLKAGLLAILYLLFFSPAYRTSETPELLRAHIMQVDNGHR
jgi:hypothetical protein